MPRKTVTLTPRQRCDLEMLLNGGFNPLTGFMDRADYEQVVARQLLADGSVWPMPVTLDVGEECASMMEPGEEIHLLDADRTLLARMQVTQKWKPDRREEARQVFGSTDPLHPGVDYLLNQSGCWYLGGSVSGIRLPAHYDFTALRHTPEQLRGFFAAAGWERIVGFQTRNPMHRAHMEMTLRAMREVSGHVLLHPVAGMTKDGDIDYYTRVRCYEKILHHYPSGKAALSLLPLAMRMGGPREAVWHALIRKNYGCTHFIVGRHHADPGNDSHGNPFYGPYAAQEAVGAVEAEIGIRMLAFPEIVYVRERKRYCPVTEVLPHETVGNVSGTQLRAALREEAPIPDWFSFPDVLEELQASCPPRHKQGLTLFFTGLSGPGKTTLAQALIATLRSLGKRNATLLDGDVIRTILTPDLGFSKADRDANIERIGYVASEITRTGGIALCAAIAPYAEARDRNRRRISACGGYIEIHVATPLAICEARDVKGLYARARAGQIPHFTGLDAPYEPPLNAEITIDTSECSVQEAVARIVDFLITKAWLKPEQTQPLPEYEEEYPRLEVV